MEEFVATKNIFKCNDVSLEDFENWLIEQTDCENLLSIHISFVWQQFMEYKFNETKKFQGNFFIFKINFFLDKSQELAKKFIDTEDYKSADRNAYEDWLGKHLDNQAIEQDELDFHWNIYEEFLDSYIPQEVFFLFCLDNFFR